MYKQILLQLKTNMEILDSLRQQAAISSGNELLEINETIQLIRYDNERLVKQLLTCV